MILLHDDPFLPAAPARPRLAEPELRARVAGYLDGAVSMPDGLRTDGVWVWPAGLAESVLQLGVGPARPLLDHITARSYLPPNAVAEEFWRVGGWRAAAQPPPVESTGPYYVDAIGRIWVFYLGVPWPVEPLGMVASTDTPLSSPKRSELREVPTSLAARLLDEVCTLRHDELIRAGAEADRGQSVPCLARTFDAAGSPRFSPNRARLVEPWRRERVAAYLEAGRLVIRATGKASDPLSDDPEPVLPLGWRTDGVWVWQETLAYYVRSRGIAPELALLCHIEGHARGWQEATSDDAVRRAVAVVHAGPPPWPNRRTWTYYASARTETGPAVETRVVLRADADLGDVEVLDFDLRWRPTREGQAALATLIEIPEAEAVEALEARLQVVGVSMGGVAPGRV